MSNDGVADAPPLDVPRKVGIDDPPWKSLRILNGNLWVVDTASPEKKITYPAPSGHVPFTRIPRKAALEITEILNMEESNKYCLALNGG